MAYNVSQNYRNIVYSGAALYNCQLYVNNNLIPITQISSITISSPIIDTTNDNGSVFHIGTFISQKLEIKFKNLNGINLTNNPEIELQIGMYVDDDYEYVPIGKYLVDELAENYQETCTITCLDYAVKFKPELDISQFFNQTTTNTSGEEIRFIYASDLFEAICNYYGVEIGTYPNVNNDKPIYFYDNTISGKQYIMYLAELFGGNAKIQRDGSCSIIPLKNYTNIEIDALSSKKFEIGNTYELTRVCYDNGKQKYQAGGNVISVDSLPTTNIDINSYYYLTTNMKYYKYVNSSWQERTEIKNTLYLRTDNMFITQQADIDAIYNAVQNFTITNITCENRMDLSLDCWDIVKYVVNNNEYYTFYDNTIKFNGVAMGTVKVNIPLKNVEENTNKILNNPNNLDTKIRKIQTTVNEQDLIIETVVENVGEQDAKISTLTQTVDELSAKISDVADVTTHGESNNGIVILEDINASEPITVKVHPIVTNISYLYPSLTTYPSSETYLKIRTLRFTRTYEEEEVTKTENIDYQIPDDLLYYDENTYDEFYLDYESQTCQITKRCGYNQDGSVYALENETVVTYDYPSIPLGDGDYTISLLGYTVGYLFVRLMASNIYTTQFATKVELNSAITQTTNNINLSVDEKLTNYSTTTQMNSAISISSTQILNQVSETYETKNNANSKYSEINQRADIIESKVEDIENISDIKENEKTVTLENCIKGMVLELHIYGNNTVFDYLRIGNDVIISNDLKVYGDSEIVVTDENGNSTTYELGITDVLRQVGDVRDEYILQDGYAQVIRRISSSGTVLEQEEIEYLGEFSIALEKGINTITIKNYTATLKAVYAIQNEYTEIFATQVDMQSSIQQTAQEINIEVSKKVGNDEIISKINASNEGIVIQSDKIDISGKAVNFKTNISETLGPYTEEDRIRVRDIIRGEIIPTQEDYDKYDIDGNNSIRSSDYISITKAINNNDGYYVKEGTFEINPYSMRKSIALYDNTIEDYVAVISLSSSTFKQIYTNRIDLIHPNDELCLLNYSQLSLKDDDNYQNIYLEANSSIDDNKCSYLSLSSINPYSSIDMYAINNGTAEILLRSSYSITRITDNKIICNSYQVKNAGTVMYGYSSGNTYRCLWTNSALHFYVDATDVGQLSDKRLKKDIKDIDEDLIKAISELKYKEFKKDNRNGLISVGIIAQDLMKVFKKYGKDPKDYEIFEEFQYNLDEETLYYKIDYEQFLILKTKAQDLEIQEMKQQLKILQEEIKSLKGGNK